MFDDNMLVRTKSNKEEQNEDWKKARRQQIQGWTSQSAQINLKIDPQQIILPSDITRLTGAVRWENLRSEAAEGRTDYFNPFRTAGPFGKQSS